MATEDLYKGVNFNDGEEVVFGDINDSQRFLSARLFDQLIERLVPAIAGTDQEFNSEAGANVSTSYAFALAVGGAHPKQGSANNKVKIATGTLFQKVANSDGNEPTLLAYTFPGTDEVAIANGDATHPRVDLVCMQLSYVTDDPESRDFQDAVTGANTSQVVNKKRRVQCALSVVAGVPAATPAYPAATAGSVAIAAVVVPTAYAFGSPLVYTDDGTHAVLNDLRFPLGIQVYYAYPDSFIYDPAKWTVQSFRRSIKCTDTTGNPALFVPCPVRKGRLIGMDIVSKNTGATTAFTNALFEPSGFGDGLSDISLGLTVGAAFVNAHLRESDIGRGPPAGLGAYAGSGPYNVPVWCNGSRCPSEARTIAGGNTDAPQVGLYLSSLFANTEIGLVTFYVAEGL